ncbi:uncharacterized protein LOC131300350 [Rhododendron vialii]|uniref:uncharacterized protein LOC131300350 n=1 Tax=Rhododendron vialii TaxID=182163 RepID=UPI00265E763D|nr:uncharacterized protein LOC131300350 [Rhododendron vialii]
MAEANNDSGLGQEEKQKKGKSPVVENDGPENDHSYPIADGVGNDHCSIGSSDDYSYPIADGVGNKHCSIGLSDDYSYPIADGVGNKHCSIGLSDDYSYPIADGVGNKHCSIGLSDDYSYPIADGVGNEHCSIGSSDDGAAEDSVKKKKKRKKRKREKEKEGGVVNNEQDPLVLFGSDIMMKVLKNLDARSVALSLLVSRGWYGVASSDRLWTAKCEELWLGKAHIPRSSQVRGLSKLATYSISVMDGQRTRIMKEDLCDHVWEFHFNEAAPEYWRNLDPYWKGTGQPMRRYFHPDGSLTADPGDEVWGGHESCYSIVTSFMGEGTIRDHYVRINRWPRMLVVRKEDWSWEMTNNLYCYSTIPDADKEGGTVSWKAPHLMSAILFHKACVCCHILCSMKAEVRKGEHNARYCA